MVETGSKDFLCGSWPQEQCLSTPPAEGHTNLQRQEDGFFVGGECGEGAGTEELAKGSKRLQIQQTDLESEQGSVPQQLVVFYPLKSRRLLFVSLVLLLCVDEACMCIMCRNSDSTFVQNFRTHTTHLWGHFLSQPLDHALPWKQLLQPTGCEDGRPGSKSLHHPPDQRPVRGLYNTYKEA